MLDKFSKWRARGKDSNEAIAELETTNIPNHVAIIMDGNGRWAKKRGLPRIAGHREGIKAINKIVRQANQLDVKVLTLYAFSTENWKRPKAEVDYLLSLPEIFFKSELPILKQENVNVRLMGSMAQLPEHTLKAVRNAVEETKDNDGLILNFALNYGSRSEMLEAIKQISEDVAAGKLSSDEVTEEVMSSYLMTASISDPDLLIRTSGEIRLSNFMLWQAAYSELWFTDVLWPDFNESHFAEAIAVYQKRARRYGGV
ncbi:isoprenyl transferase [Alkalihalobacillus pseudalcaliphilus]|uniref:isoprenyl transferase n=1 Tax=Alkalihalobacillus pseudalcaliphilus TaxID=79884 RepID=UPI00064D94EF|nr:isoprenyl transferase [Alkalihalobacillus pseudalcaliphilus]KMK77243.1 UDP pyrophosphate synthase [Alkalihalobacillus pseudalcaliphilus]